MTMEEPKKSLFTKQTKILLASYVLEMILIFANIGVLFIGQKTNVLLVFALLAVSLFTFIYAKHLKKANKLIK